MSRKGLTGEVSEELGDLSNLEVLSLSGNQLTGEIPTELGALSNLEVLFLSGNQLTGEVPTGLGNLSSLERLSLISNQLTGELPEGLTGLSALESFHFYNNPSLCAPVDEAFQAWLRSIASAIGSSCATVDSVEDRAVLVELYDAMDGENWTANTNWLSDRPIREWHGVTIDASGRVNGLVLVGNGLTGELPMELVELSNLTHLILSGNQLEGEIPTELGSLSNLRELYLSVNQLTGEIPTQLGDLSTLTRLSLSRNQLTGRIPMELGSLSNLTRLFLDRNPLEGEIPTELGDLSNLKILDLSGNQLSGELPQSLTGLTMLVRLFFDSNAGLCAPTDEAFQTWLQGIAFVRGSSCVADSAEDRAVLVELHNATDGANWTDDTSWLSDEPMRTWHGVTTDDDGRVAELSLSDNQLTGEIPTELANLSNLQSLDLGGNQLTGEIPAELGNLSNLERLFLGGNRIGGGIPAKLGNLTNLTELWLGDGLGLTGEIPPELSRLTQLEVIDLGGSEMSGAIPAWLGDLTRLRALYLDGNRFSGELPSELGNLSRLELLPLHGNTGLIGALPQTLTKITGLYWLTFHDTGLCAPLDESFQTWLRSILDHEGPNCLPEPPAGTSDRVIVRDMFGREVNETGLVLVDWEGHIANPAMKYFVELPGATATMSSSEPRLYFDLPSSAGPNGPTKALVSEGPTQAAEFYISIFPDRDTSDESHTLTIRYVGGGGRVSSQTIDVHVIDQDVDRPLDFNVTTDFSQDQTSLFGDSNARDSFQTVANDWAYYIDDMNLDEVPAGQEESWIWDSRGYSYGGTSVRNKESYTGFLLYGYGIDDGTGGQPSDGSYQSTNGKSLPLRRSGNISMNKDGNFNNLGYYTSLPDEEWWKATNTSSVQNDLYSIALHEVGHALVFNPAYDDFAKYKEKGYIDDPSVVEYYGASPRITPGVPDHLPDTIDPVSKRGAYGNEYGGGMPLGRWLLTKGHLLIAQAIGYVLRDTSPFVPLSLLDEPLPDAVVGTAYAHEMGIAGGTPAYHWTIDSGTLPDGLSLDSFTGTISGTPQESGTFEFTIRVQDSTDGNQGVVHAVNLNVRDRTPDSSDRAVLVELYNATDGENWTNNTNWLSDEPMRTWHGVTADDEGRVAELSLSDNQLRGEIPTELGSLPNLTRLFLGFNQLTGGIPADLGNLASLERLYLGGNGIGGRIPAELGNLTNLTELWLGDGLSISGEIPSELSRLTQLEVLDLGDGEMSGAIPTWLGDLADLRRLYLDGNRFAGEVPAELGNLSHLELLTLDGNAGLLGALPQTLSGVTGLRSLTFHNTGLCAPIDEGFQAWLGSIPDREGPNCLPEPPAGTTERVIFRDVFGREVNETGLVLVDWEGHIANPAMKYFVEMPGATAILSSGEPRLYFDLPSWAGPNGPTKALVSEGPTQAAEFHISIFPDRDTSDESHTLTIRYVVGGGRVSSQTIDVRVIDQDVDRPLEFNVIAEFRNDESGMFDDPAAREVVQQAADDWAYFIADMDLDEVLAGEELMWGPDNVRLRNAIDYTGILIGAYGHANSEMTATGGPTCGGQNHSSSGVELPIKRSGNIEFDPRGLFDTLGWIISLDEDEWWKHGVVEMGDLYPVAIHEIGHALAFNGCQDGFAEFHETGELSDAAVRAYYGSYPRLDHYSHFIDGTNDPISKRGAFGNEWDGETPDGRWLVTKLHLLVAQAVGFTLRDTTPFRELSILDEPLAEGSAGAPYTHTMNAVGGIPAYYWTIDSGALSQGLSLDSFTGTISGTPQEPGTFDFTIRVQDSTEGTSRGSSAP